MCTLIFPMYKILQNIYLYFFFLESEEDNHSNKQDYSSRSKHKLKDQDPRDHHEP